MIKIMELIASRHGETLSNIERRLTGKHRDSPLTEKGIAQAKELGAVLKDISFDAVYSSHLNRALSTVNIAFGGRYKILVDERLSEIGLGVMEGMLYEEAAEKYPESGMLFFTDPVSYKAPPGGESLEDMIKRIGSFVDDIAEKNYDKVFILTHGYALRVLYACMKDRKISSIAEAPAYSNCDICRYIFENNKWELKEFKQELV